MLSVAYLSHRWTLDAQVSIIPQVVVSFLPEGETRYLNQYWIFHRVFFIHSFVYITTVPSIWAHSLTRISDGQHTMGRRSKRQAPRCWSDRYFDDAAGKCRRCSVCGPGHRLDKVCGGTSFPLRWRHNGRDSVSNHQPHDCLLNRLFRRRSKNTSKLRVTGLCAGNSPWTGEFPAQMASNAENVSICWHHHDACSI